MKARPTSRLARASVARSAAGRRAKKTNGFAPAAMSGILSTREASALRACTTGVRPSASRAHGGRRIRSGMQREIVAAHTAMGGHP